MENFILITAYLILGVALRLTGRLPSDFSNHLNLFVIYVSLPALVLLKVPQMAIASDLLFTVVLPWLMVALGAVLVLALSRMLGLSRKVTGCLLLMACLGNTSFLGIPMVRAFFGEDAVAYAMIYDQLGSFLALATYGSLVLALFSGEEGSVPSKRDVAVKIGTFPPFLALLAAFVIRPFMADTGYPHGLERFLASLGSTLVPVVMTAVGYQLRLRLEQGTGAALAAGLGIKMVAAPLAALMAAWALGLEGLAAQVAVFEAGMPPMVSAGALAIMAGLAPRLTAALVGLGIVLSFLTLPALHRVMGLLL